MQTLRSVKMQLTIFQTSAFTQNLFARHAAEQQSSHEEGQLLFRLLAPQVTPEQIVALTGNHPALGDWNPEQALPLAADRFPQWEIRLDIDKFTFPLEYKFIVLDSQTRSLCYWEEGENRIIYQAPPTSIIDDYPLRAPLNCAWKTCGVVAPVFSLRSDNSFGIGDIGDLRKLIDWAKTTGQHVVQILPMNDTTRLHTQADSYPYSAISIYALHPLYINIPMMGRLNNKQKVSRYERIRRKLNDNDVVDYPSVETYKTEYYRDYFKQEKDNIRNNKDFKIFVEQNKEWLLPYAAFSYLRDHFHTPEFGQWGEYARYDRDKIEQLFESDDANGEFLYIYFIQYTLHTQFKAVSEYARANRVVLKGDIPIGINRESVEAWTEPHYFNMHGQSGAPPDDFSDVGQNWSFPTYNWEVMEQDDFAWWKKRFRKLSDYFDCFRIDHILGFFRIWEIPQEYVDGLCGHFRPALPLSKDEIENYGLTFDEAWIVPRIHVRFMQEIFGETSTEFFNLSNYSNVSDARTPRSYFKKLDAEHLILNDFCSTQQKIARLFEGSHETQTRDGLMRIANEVLFLRDPYDQSRYHPRISACHSFAYQELTDNDKRAFDAMYNDFYFMRHNDFWKETAIKRLTPLVNSTNMLVCGEDLGMIPTSVGEVMKQLQICSLELERLSKVSDCEFTDLTRLPYLSVCTTSTHDMNPVRAWWNEDRDKTQRYYNQILQRDGEAPFACTPEIAEQIIARHLHASSLLTVIPLQDWLAIDADICFPDAASERINIPSDPNHYWRYRIHLTLERLIDAERINKKIKRLIADSGRL